MTNLVRLLDTLAGASFVGLDTKVKIKLNKGRTEATRNPHFDRVTKLNEGAQVMVFTNTHSNGYANMVHRRLAALGKDPADFTLSPRVWGTRIPNFPFIKHEKDGEIRHYLEVIYLKPGKSTYYLDDEVIAKEDIQGLPKTEINEEAQGGLGETPDKIVQVRSYLLDSIVQIRYDQLKVVGPFHLKF